ncbi:nuclear transport factor 2 family protein [Chitinophaga caeni]|nr:nuclear transport factor 2 family protein [Chitinophaga caeni]
MKYFIAPIFGMTLTFCACNQDRIPAEDTVNTHSALINEYFDNFNQHDWKSMAAMYSDTAAFKDPSLGQGLVYQTHEQIIHKYTALQQGIPDVNDTIINMYPSGDDYMIVEFISRGTLPDSTTFTLPICSIFKIENGKITNDFTYYNNSGEK